MLTLYINNQPADISESSIIALTKTYENVHNPLLYYADYSKTIELPISAKNNAIFSNFNRLDSTVTNVSIDPTKKIPAFILNNQEKVLEGYVQLNNANTIWNDENYNVTFYSTLGLVLNELKLLTFNKNAVDVEPQYIIDSPISDDLVIDRNLVKQSFEQTEHYLDGDNVTDWIGFIPTYQGKYSDFSSDKEQLLPSGRTDDMSRERDEHYKREFRSYYQQPFIWVDKLWKTAKDKIDSITDYTLNLDASWFASSNPYYKDLIYTCPSLFNSDDNFRASTENYTDDRNVLMFNKPSKDPALSTHQTYQLMNLTSSNNTGIFDPLTGIFNSNRDFGSTKFKGRFNLTLFASIPDYANNGCWYCKITDDNPFYVRLKAVNADTNEDIYGASKTFLLYSDSYSVNTNTFDEGIDLGVCNIANTGVDLGYDGVTGYRPMIANTGYQTGSNHAWECDIDFELNVAENAPYKVCVEVWNANNGDPFEYTSTFSNILWDWLWTDRFNTSFGANNDKGYSMYFDTTSVSCESTENLRSGSSVSLYRVFPKDVTLCDVLLNYSKMFGLVWDVNEYDKTITVMTRNRFFSDYHIEDWTERIDRSKDFVMEPLNFDKRYVEFNYENGKCHRLKNYESTYEVTYGSKKLDTGYEFNAETNKLLEKQTPSVVSQKRQYSIMMNTEYEDRPNFMGYSYMVYPQERYVDNDDEGKNAGMSGAFYFRNGTFTPDSRLSPWDANGDHVVVITDDTQHMIQTQEFCWNSCGENVTMCYALPDVSTISRQYDGERYSVHFERPKEYYFDTPDGTVNYIYHSFWENYINERYCSQNKKLTAYVYISIDEFKDIDFREFVKIDNILYHIDKIYDFDYNSYEPVKMDLVQVWDLSAYTQGQSEIPYLFTVPQSVELKTTNQTVPVYTNYNGWHIARKPDWVTVSIDGNGDLAIKASTTTPVYRNGFVMLSANNTGIENSWLLEVHQYPTNPYRLEVDRNTIVFDANGGTEIVNVDCHNKGNNAITVTTNASWIKAVIKEYSQTVTSRRDVLHLAVTASPRTATTPRNGIVTLSITTSGTTYSQTIKVGQQGGNRHTRDVNYRLVTDTNSDLVVYDDHDNPVNVLYDNKIYHFKDLFPEEIDVDSIQITGGGSVTITGNSGEQTVTFIPQLSNGDQIGGGLITATTLNGNIVSYAYNVQVEGYTPTPEPPTPPTPPTPQPAMKDTYFFIEDISGSANTVSVTKSSSTSTPTVELYYSDDQTNWTLLGNTSTTPLTVTIPAYEKLYFKATANTWCAVNYTGRHNYFSTSGLCNVGGNIMSLLYGDNFQNKTTLGYDYTFANLFKNVMIVNAKDLVLPATTLSEYCYYQMFNGCSSLTTPPALPATTLAAVCYENMFYNCTGLTTAPALPATILATSCYVNMFNGCTSLTAAPALPATTLANGCYYQMFKGCTGLTSTPMLPATTLVYNCYYYMFNGCTSLNEAHVAADDNSASNCINNWLYNVAPTGDFYNYGSAVYTIDDPSGIPLGWTPHSVTPPTPTPSTRHIIVVSDSNSMFRIEASPSVMPAKTTNYFEDDFVDGTTITVTALPNTGYTLYRWVDNGGNEYNTTSVTFTVDQSIVDANNIYNIKLETVPAQRTVTLTINAGDGYVTVGSDATHYQTFTRTVIEGTTITNVKVTSNSPISKPFNSWSDGSVSNPRDFTMYADTTLSVVYGGSPITQSTFTLDGGGLLGGNDYIKLYLDNAEVLSCNVGEIKTYKTTETTYNLVLKCHINDNNSTFSYFDIAGTQYAQNPYQNPTFNFSDDTYIKVSCVPNYSVSINTGNNGTITVNGVTGDYSANVPQGTTLALQATPNTGYSFSGWSDGDNNNPRTLTVSGNTNITANFVQQQCNVSVLAGSNGSVTVNGVGGDYTATVPYGTSLAIQATPNAGYVFTGWSDTATTVNPRALNVTGDITVTASFASAPNYNVTVTAGNNGTVAVDGVTGNYSSSVQSGTTLYIEAIPNVGYSFDSWSDGVLTAQRTETITGNTALTAIFTGSLENTYFYVEDISGSDNTLRITKNVSSAPTITVYKSTDQTNWTSMGSTSTNGITATVPANGKLYLKATTGVWYDTYRYNTIKASGLHNVGGNIMSLLYSDNFQNKTTFSINDVFNSLFYNDINLVNAENLALPATTLAIRCYNLMFYGCTSLTTAPALPATTLVGWCYAGMFNSCTSLTTPPALPATTLAERCYSSMFEGCTSLTTAPALPATTMVFSCYSFMFQGCTSLTTAPALNATTMVESCYGNMFNGCTSLTTAPALPATTMAQSCYDGMFSGCTSLTTAPVLPATTLAIRCYALMFQGCTNLNKVTTYAQDISAADCIVSWLNDVSGSGDFYNLGGATYTADSGSGIPVGWTEH